MPAQTHNLQRLWRPLLLIILVVAGLVLTKVFHLDQALRELRPWIASFGTYGPLVYLLIYVVASIATLPGSVLTVAAGVLFGSFWGVIWASLASVLAASSCFLIARYFARQALEESLKEQPAFQRLEKLTENQGPLIVAITRLLPIFPFNLLNYGFGLTRVSFLTYVGVSWICMLPATIVFVVGSDVIKQSLETGQIPWLLLVLVLGLIGLLSLISYLARKKLREAEDKLS